MPTSFLLFLLFSSLFSIMSWAPCRSSTLPQVGDRVADMCLECLCLANNFRKRCISSERHFLFGQFPKIGSGHKMVTMCNRFFIITSSENGMRNCVTSVSIAKNMAHNMLLWCLVELMLKTISSNKCIWFSFYYFKSGRLQRRLRKTH